MSHQYGLQRLPRCRRLRDPPRLEVRVLHREIGSEPEDLFIISTYLSAPAFQCALAI